MITIEAIKNTFRQIPKSKAAGLITVVAITIAIPLTVYLAQQQQDLRQLASGEQTQVYLAQSGSDVPLSNIQLVTGQQISLDLYLDAGTNNASGFDIAIRDQNVTSPVMSNMVFIDGPGAALFNTEVFRTVDPATGIRFTKVSTAANANISGRLMLGTMRFTPQTTGVQGNITFGNAVVTSIASVTPLTVGKTSLSYTIGEPATPTPTPTLPPGVSPTDTPIPTESPTPTPTLPPDVSPTDTPTPTQTPSPTVTPTRPPGITATNTPTPTPTLPPGVSPTNTPTPGPTATYTPTPTPVPGHTVLLFTLSQQAIGGVLGSNPNPVHRDIPLDVRVSEITATGEQNYHGNLSYNRTTGKFTASVDAGNLVTGIYNIRVRIDKNLVKLLPNQSITQGIVNRMPEVSLVSGDVNDDNFIDILDYNLVAYVCFGQQASLDPKCVAADLNDDGKVDIIDVNYLFSNIATREGD